MKMINATAAALRLISEIQDEHGEVLFHQSGGCCDGSAPMCFKVGDLFLGDNDKLLGKIGGASFFMSKDQFEAWNWSSLMVDAIEGNGGMFSLDSGRGMRFVLVP